jgi:hypothetical protein
VPARILRDWVAPVPAREAAADAPPKSPDDVLREMAALGVEVPEEWLREGVPDAGEPAPPTSPESEDG